MVVKGAVPEEELAVRLTERVGAQSLAVISAVGVLQPVVLHTLYLKMTPYPREPGSV